MRRTSALLAVGLVLATLTACDPPKGDTPQRLRYVALGDSYTAAPGIGPASGFVPCRQSGNNYPHQLADKVGLILTDMSCSGARTSAVTEEQPLGAAPHEPQINGLSDRADIVTVGLGANDFNLVGAIITVCVALAAKDPDGSPCTDLNDAAKKGERAAARLDQVEDNLVQVVETVRERAPDARIILIGYPQMFPDPKDGGCKDFPIAKGDLAYARTVNIGLNDAMEAAAKATEVEYVDLFSRTEGHDICGEDPWVAGIRRVPGKKAAPYHPYVEEQKLVVEVLDAMID